MENKFMLFSVADRSISYEFYPTLELAQEQMRKEIVENCRDNLDNYEEGTDYEIGEMSAWSNANDIDFDAEIVEL